MMDYITTYQKVHFTPLDPREEDILIEDIAHALSLMSRANGHFPAFHSVAQHCIECCEEALARGLSQRIALACLLHDASEAYLADITRPVKQHLPQYRAIEHNLLNAIYQKYLKGITEEEEGIVKEIDDTLLYYEFFHFMGEELSEKPTITKLPDFAELPFRTVEKRYLELFTELSHALESPDRCTCSTACTDTDSASFPFPSIDGITFFPSNLQSTCFDWKQPPLIKGVLFDMDGLILDTEKLYSRFWQEAAHAFGYPMTQEQSFGLRSLNHTAGEVKIHAYFGEDAPYHAIRAKRIELMDAFVEEHGVSLKPGVEKLLDYLHQNGIRTAIATSSPIERTTQYLSSVNLETRFDTIVTAYMVKQGKPEPYIYELAAEKLGLQPGECLALEDSPSGLLAAARAGCIPVMIPDQDQPNTETQRLLFAKADRLDHVIGLLETIRTIAK